MNDLINAATTVAEEAAKTGYITPARIIVWVIGGALIAFCLFKFITGRKKLKAKQAAEAEAKEEEAQHSTSEEDF